MMIVVMMIVMVVGTYFPPGTGQNSISLHLIFAVEIWGMGLQGETDQCSDILEIMIVVLVDVSVNVKIMVMVVKSEITPGDGLSSQ